MQTDFVNGVFDVASRGYRVRLIGGRPATLIRKGLHSKWCAQLGMVGEWETYPDAPTELSAALERFIDEQTSGAVSAGISRAVPACHKNTGIRRGVSTPTVHEPNACLA